jgi:hypothetical protein
MLIAQPAWVRDDPGVVPGEYTSGVAMKAQGPQPENGEGPELQLGAFFVL